MTAFNSGEIFGNGSGVAKDLTSSFVSGGGDALEIVPECDLICKAVVSANDCDWVEFRIDWSLPDAGGFIPLPYSRDAASLVTQGTRVYRIPGDIDSHAVVFHLPANVDVKVMARQVGGSGTTKLLVTGALRPDSSEGLAASLGGAAGGSSFDVLSTLAIDDGSGSAKTLTGAYFAGSWFDTAEGDQLILLCEVTNAAATTIELLLEVSYDSGTTAYTADVISGIVSGGATTHDENEHVIDGSIGNRIARIECPSNCSARISAKYTGGAAPDLLATVVVAKRS